MLNDVITDQTPRSSRSIQEFWIDFLLEEEFTVSDSFCAAFLSACDYRLRFHSVIDVTHSVGDRHGEADLIVRVWASYGNETPERVALLIEDKITAGFQPRQAERYRLRGEDGLLDRRWDRFITVLVAPDAYLSQSSGFDIPISFESLKAWIATDDPKRREFKLHRLDEAISKKNAHGVQVVDRAMTAFRSSYYDCLSAFNLRVGTDFKMRPPKDTYYGDTWFILKSDRLPHWCEIRHMASSGNVEITFKDTDLQKAAHLEHFLPQGMVLMSTGKYQQHVTIRASVPKILAFTEFEAHRGQVEVTFAAANTLLSLFEGNRAEFESILAVARSTQVTPHQLAGMLVAK